MLSLAIRTATMEGLASAEFCGIQRRIAHLVTMYGFLAYTVTTAIMVFAYPTPTTPAPAILPALWTIGALMVCFGGYWFWFFIRVDVAAEGNSPSRMVPADLFVVSLLASVTLGLVWAYLQTAGGGTWTNIFLALYLAATTVLFGSVPWSKFSHMFYKPAAGPPETGGRGQRFQAQPAGPRRQARSFRQRPPTAPALLAGRSPVFDRRDSSGSCRRLYI